MWSLLNHFRWNRLYSRNRSETTWLGTTTETYSTIHSSFFVIYDCILVVFLTGLTFVLKTTFVLSTFNTIIGNGITQSYFLLLLYPSNPYNNLLGKGRTNFFWVYCFILLLFPVFTNMIIQFCYEFGNSDNQ